METESQGKEPRCSWQHPGSGDLTPTPTASGRGEWGKMHSPSCKRGLASLAGSFTGAFILSKCLGSIWDVNIHT